MLCPRAMAPLPKMHSNGHMGGITSKTWSEAFGEFKEGLRKVDQHSASIEHNARQLRLAMETDVPAGEKTRERTEGATTAVQAMYGDNVSAKKV